MQMIKKILYTVTIFSAFCGIRPLAPVGCHWRDAMCVCDKDHNCEWVFVCK